jgi:8-oxo-dGTP diphosphatase
LAGGWEFPGGKVDDTDPSNEEACRREIREELGVEIDILAPLPGPLPDGAWPMAEDYALNVFICRIAGDKEPELLEQHDEMTWVSLDDPLRVEWLEVDLPPLHAAIEWVRSHL